MRLPTSRFTSFGTSALSRPVFFFSLICLTCALIFTTLILVGSSTESAAIRQWYLVSFKYDTSSTFYKALQKLNKADDLIDKGGELLDKGGDLLDKGGKEVLDKGEEVLDKINPFDKRAENSEPTFSQIRVSYRGICVETTDGWDCAHTKEGLQTQEVDMDPLQLISVADLYRDKIAWSVPFWIALTGIAVAYIMVLVNALPIPCLVIPLWTKKVAAGALGIAGVASLGGMILGSVTSSSVASLVTKVSFDAIQVHEGRMVIAFGWTTFALVTASFLGVSAVVFVEWGAEKARMVAEAQGEKAVRGITGDRLGLDDMERAAGFQKTGLGSSVLQYAQKTLRK